MEIVFLRSWGEGGGGEEEHLMGVKWSYLRSKYASESVFIHECGGNCLFIYDKGCECFFSQAGASVSLFFFLFFFGLVLNLKYGRASCT